MQTTYLLPLTIAALLVAVAALGFRAQLRRGYGPLAVGAAAAVLLLVGRFVLDSDIAAYSAAASLIAASIWNTWPARLPAGVPHAPTGVLIQLGSTNQGEAKMAAKRKIEVFSAGCPACAETVTLVQSIACPSCDVSVLDMHDSKVAQRAKSLGIRSVPAVVINGKLADCCTGRGPDAATLRSAGLGQPI